MKETRQQILRFLAVGATTALIDFATYASLYFVFGLSRSFAKALGFLCGTFFAYFANRIFTFAGTNAGAASVLSFCLLYAVSLGVNVAVNEAAFWVLGIIAVPINVRVGAAFVVATAVSATCNFIGMKLVVFTAREDADPHGERL